MPCLLQPRLLSATRSSSARDEDGREWNKEEGGRSGNPLPELVDRWLPGRGHVGLRIREILRRGSRDANKFANEPPRATNSSQPDSGTRGIDPLSLQPVLHLPRYLSPPARLLIVHRLSRPPPLREDRLIFPATRFARTKARRKPERRAIQRPSNDECEQSEREESE